MNILQIILKIWNKEQIAEQELDRVLAQVDLDMKRAINRELTRIKIEAELNNNRTLEVSKFFKI